MATNPYTAPTLTGYNASPPADDASQTGANQLFWSTIKTKLPDPLKTFAEAINTAVTTAFAKTVNTDDAEQNTLQGSLAFGSDELTILSGAITPDRSHHTVDTEADASTDNLDTINTSGVGDGTLLFLRAQDAARAVTVRDGVGNVSLYSDSVVLDTTHPLALVLIGASWAELGPGSFGLNALDTANVGRGMVIKVGGNDSPVLAFKSSDVSHPMTSNADADIFATIGRPSPASGGIQITGYKDADGNAGGVVVIEGRLGEVADTTKSTTAKSIVQVFTRVTDGGTTVADPAANSNLFSVQLGSGTAKFIVDAEGDLHVDGSGTLATFDAYDDAALARTLDLELADGVIDSKWDEFVGYNRETLVDLGILGKAEDGGDPMINVTRLQRVHNGAIWQLSTQIREMGERLEAAERKLLTADQAAIAGKTSPEE